MSDTLINRFEVAFEHLPLVAIMRGVRPDEALPLTRVLYDQGFRLIEIPLNSPDPFTSIEAVRKALPTDALVGAGTVTSVAEVSRLAAIGADLVVMPHSDSVVIKAARAADMICTPGIATPTEAFAALAAGANALKCFPAELLVPAVVKAIKTILPKNTKLLPVGGIRPDNMHEFFMSGAAGFGLGSALYKPGLTATELAERAQNFVTAIKNERKVL
jgi:2-dehydro-3-deoxyphosphogalactonate aldolase